MTKFMEAIEKVTEFIIGKKNVTYIWNDDQDWKPKWASDSEFGTPKPKPKRKYKRKKK
jgi:hypothetical protein